MITTIEEFIEAVPKDGWYLHGNDSLIRRIAGEQIQCPVSSLCGVSAFDYPEASLRRIIDANLARRIAYAADDHSYSSPEIRQTLLDALISNVSAGSEMH